VAKLLAKGSRVYVIEEDLAERGIERDELTPGLTLLRAAQLPRLMADYGMVWHW
jgi:sulfur relay (sulfurtransferase) DsrF/TusC family protein